MTLELESKASQVVDWGGGKGATLYFSPDHCSTRGDLQFFSLSLFPHCQAWSQVALQIEMFQMIVHLCDNTLTICKQANDTYSH